MQIVFFYTLAKVSYILLYQSGKTSNLSDIFLGLRISASIPVYLFLYPSISFYIHLNPSIPFYVRLYPSVSLYIRLCSSIFVYSLLYPSISFSFYIRLYASISFQSRLKPSVSLYCVLYTSISTCIDFIYIYLYASILFYILHLYPSIFSDIHLYLSTSFCIGPRRRLFYRKFSKDLCFYNIRLFASISISILPNPSISTDIERFGECKPK